MGNKEERETDSQLVRLIQAEIDEANTLMGIAQQSVDLANRKMRDLRLMVKGMIENGSGSGSNPS